jgi:hemolysin type calcium-binding protein
MRRVVLVVGAMTLVLLLASGVALAVNKIGTNGPDTLRGTHGDDNLLGKGGNDVLFALRGHDNLLGGSGKDWVLGGNERIPFGGEKNLVGGPGNDGVVGGIDSDTLLGGTGSDYLLGDDGPDRVQGNEGRDLVEGGRGADRLSGGGSTDILISGPIEERVTNTLSGGAGDDIFVVDNVPAAKDRVSCGRGFDRVIADRKDVVGDDCEKVRVVRGSLEEVFEQEAAFFEAVPPAVTEFFGPWGPFFPTFFERLAPDPTAGEGTPS